MGWNELSDPDMRTANFEFSCDVYREGVYKTLGIVGGTVARCVRSFPRTHLKRAHAHRQREY